MKHRCIAFAWMFMELIEDEEWLALLHINLDCIAGILEVPLGTDEALAALVLKTETSTSN